MNPFKEILARASRVFADEREPVLSRIGPDLRDMLFDAEPGKFYEAVDTVNAFLELSRERYLSRREVDDAWQIHYLRHPEDYSR